MLLFILLIIFFILIWVNNQYAGLTVAPRPLMSELGKPLVLTSTRTLIISGGGIRGLAAVMYLKNLYASDQTDFFQKFDVFSGTSTGTIIASAICARQEIRKNLVQTKVMQEIESYFGHSLSSVSDSRFCLLYLEFLYMVWSEKRIFVRSLGRTLTTLGGLVGAEFPSPIQIVMDIFGDLRMSNMRQGLILIAQELGTNNSVAFNNINEKGLRKSQLFYLGEIVCMCISTPVVFPAYAGYVDGGATYNNPVQPVYELLQFSPKLSIVNIQLDNKQQKHTLTTSNNGVIQWLPYALNFFLSNTSFISSEFEQVLERFNVQVSIVKPMDLIDLYVGLMDCHLLPQFLSDLQGAYPNSDWVV